MNEQPICPKCGSKHMVKAGRLRFKEFGYDKQRYRCKDCGRYTVNPIRSELQ